MSRILLIHGAFGGAWCRERAAAPFGAPVQLAGLGRDAVEALPRAYVVCKRDRAIPPPLPRLMLEAAGRRPAVARGAQRAAAQVLRVRRLPGALIDKNACARWLAVCKGRR